MRNSKKPAWTPTEIKRQLVDRTGLPLYQIAQKWGFNNTAIHVALTHGWGNIELKIAETLGCFPHEIFPDRYDRDGNRITGLRTKQNPSTGENRRLVQSSEAA